MTGLPAPELPPWIAGMLPADTTRYRVDVGGHEMHVMEHGEGRPVLMVHGNPTWGFLYREVVSALTGQPLRAIVPDLVGLGFSDRCTPNAHQLENHCRWMGALIDALDLDELIFVGQDWGGPIGLGALAERPERMAGMVLLNTTISEPRENFRPTAFHRFSRLPLVSQLAFKMLGFPQVALWAAQGDRSTMRGDVARAYRYPLRGLRNRVAPLGLARMVPHTHAHPSIPRLRQCRQFVQSFAGPVAVVWGDLDPILGGVIGWVEKLLPEASVTRTQAGHFLQEEVPDQIAAAVVEVAAKLE